MKERKPLNADNDKVCNTILPPFFSSTYSMTIDSKHVEGASPIIKAAIERLSSLSNAPALPKGVSIKAQAAVAVILYQAPSIPNSTHEIPIRSSHKHEQAERLDQYEPELHVICTTRALHLNSHPGQASLPGGKVDKTDGNVMETAFRETCEEILLPDETMKNEEIIPLCVMRPFLSKTALIVHPVVFWLPPKTTSKTLNNLHPSPDEVSAIWSYPLRAVLNSMPPRQIRTILDGQPIEYGEPLMRLMEADQVDTHRPPQTNFRSFSEVPWIQNKPYRLHRFRSTHQLIKGLTADILINVASHAYRDTPFAGPSFQTYSSLQPCWDDWISYIVKKVLSGAPREKSRWGDGESGDNYGSTERHGTQIGHDYDAEGAELSDAAIRRRDMTFTLREAPVDWSRDNKDLLVKEEIATS